MRGLTSWFALVALLIFAGGAQPAGAAVAPVSTVVQVTTPELEIHAGPGHQEDPHVSGSLVTYTELSAAAPSAVRYYDLTTGASSAVPQNSLDYDFISDVNDGRITFTRINIAGSFIYLFDSATQTLREIDPGFASRAGSTIGGNTIAWVEFFGISNELAIAVHDLANSSTTVLSAPGDNDSHPSVSADGSVLVWSSCDPDGSNCDIVQAVRGGAGWSLTTLTGSAGQEGTSDSDGAVVAYDSLRAGERDIYWQPLGGGAETQVVLPGNQRNPSVSDGLIVFEGNPLQSNFHIYAYDTITSTLYQVTTAANDETLSDVEVVGDVATVVYTKFNGVDNDVFARSFSLNRQSSVEQQLSDLRASIAASGNHLTKALDAKLRAVENALGTGDTASACASLQDFINHVNAQRGKKIAVADADAWISAAEQIRLVVGCS